jgi:hypothetical protein
VDIWTLVGSAAVLIALLLFVGKQVSQFVLQKWLQAAWARITARNAPAPPPRLVVELPQPVNPLGGISSGEVVTPWWSFRVRFLVREGPPMSIVDLAVVEDGVGPWAVEELFRERGGAVVLPLGVAGADEIWLRARSPRSSARPVQTGRVVLRVRDHTQSPGEYRTVVLTEGGRM